MKIVADDKIPYLKGVFEPFAEVVYLPGGKISSADLADADVLITRTRTKCNKALLADTQVKLVATATIGIDHLNTAELDELGIVWRNAPGCNADSVKNYIASALATLDTDLTGKTLGIIGVGHVGKKIAEVGRAFGMRVLLNDPPRAEAEGADSFTELDELLAKSDVVTLHVPLEIDSKYPTLNMADSSFFDRMKQGAYFFNSCRGEVMVKEAFLAAKNSGKISGALIDVWPEEPDLDPALLAAVEIGTPHIAGYSREGKANGSAACVRIAAEMFDIAELKNFQLPELPPPVYPEVIELDNTLPVWKQLSAAVLHVYDVRRDAAALKAAPGEFEALRGSYWNRREFSAYTVKNAAKDAVAALELLGFKIG
jgi:erythronate-4-phosphate dehydrogenase